MNIPNQYGLSPVQTETTSTVVSVGTVFSQVAINNPNRLNGLFINLSTADIYIGNDPSVSIGNGILLVSSGGSFQTSAWEDLGYTGYPFYAIATAVASPLQFVETNYNGSVIA